MRELIKRVIICNAFALAGAFCFIVLVIFGSLIKIPFKGEDEGAFCYAEELSEDNGLELLFVYEDKSFCFSPDYSRLSQIERQKRCVGSLDEQIKLLDEISKTGLSDEIALSYTFTGFYNFLNHLDREFYVPPQNAAVSFIRTSSEVSPRIEKSRNGRQIDREKLCRLVIMKLKSQSRMIRIPVKDIQPDKTEELIRNETFLRASFCTRCNTANANRFHNIKLAAGALDCITLSVGEIFSFNGVVGERSESRGYRAAKVINRGEYAEGVGGGVCQVATTVYNAALSADLEIVERHRHTFKSSYIEAGFDSMVSYGGADLRIKNNTDGNVYLICNVTSDGRITAYFFGEENKYEIRRESVAEQLDNGSVKSSSYLIYLIDGKELKRVRIHGDFYYPISKA